MHGSVKPKKTDEKDKDEISKSCQSAVVPSSAPATTPGYVAADEKSDGIDDIREIGQGTFTQIGKAKKKGSEQRSNQDETERIQKTC